MVSPVVDWTDDNVSILKRMWLDGGSASEIAQVIGGGATRNAVIGKVTRLKLGKRKQAKPAASKPVKRTPDQVKADHSQWNGINRHGNKGQPKAMAIRHRVEMRVFPSHPLPEEPEDGVDVTHLLGILQINEHTCKWPIGDPLKPGFGFCGEYSEEGSPYCDKHHRRAYIRL